MDKNESHQAFLGNEGCFTVFSYGPHVVRFRTSCNLNRYLCVKEWDEGYLVVDADYQGEASPVEEYIDLVPILQNLYLEPDAFLSQIKEVCVR